MPWVRFTADFTFRPKAMRGRSAVTYKAGMVGFVTRECASEAFADGRAILTGSSRPTLDDRAEARRDLGIAEQ